ncbi:MAG: ACT domain-containing protein [Clostridiales bacterium]|jgi:ACT domain-containing protein|nr:ACT domain-containing protein [Clostridiales bacterium]
MRAVITVIGQDRVGIIAGMSTVLAQNNINIMDISQTIMSDVFTMIMLVDLSEMKMSFSHLSELLSEKGKEFEVQVQLQHVDIFNSMHKI